MVIVLVPLLIVGSMTFVNSSRTLENVSRMQLTQIAQDLSGMIQDAIERERSILMGIAADPVIAGAAASGEFGAIDAKLADLYAKVGTDYEDLGVYDTEGTIRVDAVDKSRIGISIAERDYFREGKSGKSGIGPVNASKATGYPVFGISIPLMSRDGGYHGAVLGVLKADFLVKRITSTKLGRTGYSFMVDRNGLAIAHPDSKKILKDHISDEPGLEILAKRMLLGQTGSEEYTYRGTEKVSGFAPIAPMGWSICVTQNKAEIMALAYENGSLTLLSGCLCLALTILVLFFSSRLISTPVQNSLVMLNRTIEQATEAVFIVGPDRKVRFVNPAMAAIVGRPVPELVGAQPYLDNTAGMGHEEIWGQLDRGRKWSGRITGGREDGAVFSMDATITPVRNKAGAVDSYLGIGRDVTRELMMEAQMRQGQKMEAIGTLAGGIAHDFNNILSAIFGYTELSMQGIENRETVMPYLAEILKAAGRARDLVNQILTFSRQKGEGKKPMLPRYVVKEALKLLRASLPATISIEGNLNCDASILGDPSQVHQVVMNLCTNAGYAMREHGGVLGVSLKETDLDADFCSRREGMKAGRYVQLEVRDSGTGIPPGIAERIFDPFFTTKPPGEGTGLGLSVVHGIVKELGGAVTVASAPGMGTVFTVYMPAMQGEPQAMGPETTASAVAGGTERILLVDDEEALMRAGKAMLEGMGYRVQGFTESLSAWEAFRKGPAAFDAVVTDYTMPNMTGCELARKLREIRSDLPIVLCSGYMDSAMENEVRNAGVDELVKKPLSRIDLASVLRRVLDRSKEAGRPRA